MADLTAAEIKGLMDMGEKCVGYPFMTDATITRAILDRYARYVDTIVIEPETNLIGIEDRESIQVGSDFAYLQHLAAKYGYVFEVEEVSGARPLAYWGPRHSPGDPVRHTSAG